MTREDYLNYIKDHTNNNTLEDSGIVSMVIDKMMAYDNRDSTIASKSDGELSITFKQDNGSYPQAILSKLKPYKKLRW